MGKYLVLLLLLSVTPFTSLYASVERELNGNEYTVRLYEGGGKSNFRIYFTNNNQRSCEANSFDYYLATGGADSLGSDERVKSAYSMALASFMAGKKLWFKLSEANGHCQIKAIEAR